MAVASSKDATKVTNFLIDVSLFSQTIPLLQQLIATDSESKELKAALEKVEQASKDAQALNKSTSSFPPISSVRRVGALLTDALKDIQSFKPKNDADSLTLLKVKLNLELGPGTKNGGDCRAPMVLVK